MPSDLNDSILKFRDAYRIGDSETMDRMKAESLSDPESDFEIVQDESGGIVFWRPKGLKFPSRKREQLEDSIFHVPIEDV